MNTSFTEKEKGVGLLLGGGIIAGFAALGYMGARKLVQIVGGKKALVSHTIRVVPWKSKDGKMLFRKEVVESPAELAIKASVKLGRAGFIPLTTYTLATVLASEAGRGSTDAKAAIAWAVKNAAKTRGANVFRLVAPDGKFGSQQGRYCASGQPPTETDLKVAEAVESGKIRDLTKGAVQWDSPQAQEALLKRKEAGYTKTAAQVAAMRMKDGKELVTIPGVDPSYLRLWRPRTGLAGVFVLGGDDFLRAVAG